jgi:hypothetical protein
MLTGENRSTGTETVAVLICLAAITPIRKGLGLTPGPKTRQIKLNLYNQENILNLKRSDRQTVTQAVIVQRQ